jgi:3-deoxy-D-manno-octulosonic acid (KDO) 8-phosphate synthase
VDHRHIGYIFKNSFEKHCSAAAKSKRLKLERESKLQLMSNLNAEFEEALKEERGVEARSLAPLLCHNSM